MRVVIFAGLTALAGYWLGLHAPALAAGMVVAGGVLGWLLANVGWAVALLRLATLVLGLTGFGGLAFGVLWGAWYYAALLLLFAAGTTTHLRRFLARRSTSSRQT
jgi:hypothetical protein